MLLDVIFAADGFTQYMDEFEKADMDMADTVKKISASAGNKKKNTSTKTASFKRTIQYWNSLWNRWRDIKKHHLPV